MDEKRAGPGASSFRRALANWSPAAAWMVLIFVLSAQPHLEAPGVLGRLDKVNHLAAYTILSLLVFRGWMWQPGNARASAFAASFIITALYGVLDELHQRFVPGRSCELWDWVMDAAGACLGLAAVWAVRRVKDRSGGRQHG